MVARERSALRERIAEQQGRLLVGMERYLNSLEERLRHCDPSRLHARLDDRLQQQSLHLDERRQALSTAFDWFLHTRAEALANAATPPRRPQPAHELGARFCASGTRRQQTPRPRQQ